MGFTLFAVRTVLNKVVGAAAEVVWKPRLPVGTSVTTLGSDPHGMLHSRGHPRPATAGCLAQPQLDAWVLPHPQLDASPTGSASPWALSEPQKLSPTAVGSHATSTAAHTLPPCQCTWHRQVCSAHTYTQVAVRGCGVGQPDGAPACTAHPLFKHSRGPLV